MRIWMLGAAICAVSAASPGWAWAGNQEMADEIAQRLRASGQLSGFNIKIKCEKGQVWLRGSVQNEDQMLQAMAIAKGINGVTKVVNEMEVAPAAALPQNVRPVQFAEMDAQPTPAPGPAFAPIEATEIGEPQPLPASSPAPQAAPIPVRANQPTRVQPVSARQEIPMPAVPAAPSVTEVAPGPVGPPAGYGAPQGYPAPQGYGPPPGYGPPQGYGPPPGGYGPIPMGAPTAMGPAGPPRFDQPHLPGYAWPTYAAHPNYAAVTYPRQYSPTAWPYIGPFYPYPQVPLGWRKVTLEWDDGWWMLDFDD